MYTLKPTNFFSIVAFAVVLVGCTPGMSNPGGDGNSSAPPPLVDKTYATTAQVLEAVRSAQTLTAVPDSVAAKLAKDDSVHATGSFDCHAVNNPAGAQVFGNCALGEKNSSKLMVIYGDSHADMWAPALGIVAARSGWQVRVFALHGCPGADLGFLDYKTNAPSAQCDTFHSSAIAAINELHPKLIIATSVRSYSLADKSLPTPAQWKDGWVSSLRQLAAPGTTLAMLGDIPSWPNNDARCLAAHMNDVQQCSVPEDDAVPERTAPGQGAALIKAEQDAVSSVGGTYIPTIPWVCAELCEPVIADTRVYGDTRHFSQSYVEYLSGAVDDALRPLLTAS